jgi:nicotinamide-nucleotide adenylyltransferase
MSNSSYLHPPFSRNVIEYYRSIQDVLNRLDPQAKPDAALAPDASAPEGNIIVFPGSFNPPTNAHIAMLQQAQHFGSQRHAHQVYAAFSKRTTDKETVERPLLVDRVALLEETLRNHLTDVGVLLFNRGLYVEQAEGVRTAFPAVKTLYFLLGYDKIVQIFDPHYYRDRDASLRELFRLADVLVAPRAGAGARELHLLLEKPENQPFAGHVHALPLPRTFAEMSSTRIRQDFEEHWREVPPEVREFIRETHAYEPVTKGPRGETIDRYGERVNYIKEITRGNA